MAAHMEGVMVAMGVTVAMEVGMVLWEWVVCMEIVCMGRIIWMDSKMGNSKVLEVNTKEFWMGYKVC